MNKKIAVGGMLAALAVVLHHGLALVPNVELTSLTVFLAGWLLGPLLGGMAGAVVAIAASLTSAYGLPGPGLLAAQVLAYALWGWLGGLAGLPRIPITAPVAVGAGIAGTLVFQFLLQCALVFDSGQPWQLIFGAAVPFVAVHVASNAVVFGIFFPHVAELAAPLRERLDPS